MVSRPQGRSGWRLLVFMLFIGVGLPASRRPMPWDVIPWDAAIHLGLFVHRVDGLEPGLYLLVRDPRRMGRLRAAMHARFEWSMPPGAQLAALLSAR